MRARVCPCVSVLLCLEFPGVVVVSSPVPVPVTTRALLLPPQSDKDSREDIMKVFNLFDDDSTGKITLKNLKRVAKELGETMTGVCAGMPHEAASLAASLPCPRPPLSGCLALALAPLLPCSVRNARVCLCVWACAVPAATSDVSSRVRACGDDRRG
jgi:hypothetical protein